MAQPAVRVLKILLDWAEKASVLVVASLAVSACCEGVQFFAYFKNSEFSLIICVSESGPEVGFGGRDHPQVRSNPRLSFTAWLSLCLQPR